MFAGWSHDTEVALFARFWQFLTKLKTLMKNISLNYSETYVDFNIQSEAFNPPAVNLAILQSAQEGLGTVF